MFRCDTQEVSLNKAKSQQLSVEGAELLTPVLQLNVDVNKANKMKMANLISCLFTTNI